MGALVHASLAYNQNAFSLFVCTFRLAAYLTMKWLILGQYVASYLKNESIKDKRVTFN